MEDNGQSSVVMMRSNFAIYILGYDACSFKYLWGKDPAWIQKFSLLLYLNLILLGPTGTYKSGGSMHRGQRSS